MRIPHAIRDSNKPALLRIVITRSNLYQILCKIHPERCITLAVPKNPEMSHGNIIAVVCKF